MNIINKHVNHQRRQILKSASALLVYAMTPTALHSNERPSAVVIGAGIAGLSAAYDLKKAGFQVSILEKEAFTGGRMVELKMGPLYQFTHAQSIDQSAIEMMDLAKELTRFRKDRLAKIHSL